MKLLIVLLAVWAHQQFPLPIRELLLQWMGGQWQRLLSGNSPEHSRPGLSLLLWLVLPIIFYLWLLYRVYGLTWGLWFDVLSWLTVMFWIRTLEASDWPAEVQVTAEANAERDVHLLRWARLWLQGMVAPLFWYVALGPVAITVYGLLVLVARSQVPVAVNAEPSGMTGVLPLERLLLWLDWLPGRLLVLGMAMMSDFMSGMEWLRSRLLLPEDSLFLLHDLVQNTLASREAAAGTDAQQLFLSAWVRRVHRLGLVVLALATVYAL